MGRIFCFILLRRSLLNVRSSIYIWTRAPHGLPCNVTCAGRVTLFFFVARVFITVSPPAHFVQVRFAYYSNTC